MLNLRNYTYKGVKLDKINDPETVDFVEELLNFNSNSRINTMAPKVTKRVRRTGKAVYYVGSPTVMDANHMLFEDLDDAIRRGIEMTEKDGLRRPIVQVIKVVERSRPPVVVRNPR